MKRHAKHYLPFLVSAALAFWTSGCTQDKDATVSPNPTETEAADTGAAPTTDIGNPTFSSPHVNPIALSTDGSTVFVVNTPAGTLDVISTDSLTVTHRVPVGIDPVALALRPDGQELWVSNHLSDSVSVIDTDPTSPTYLHTIATIQALSRQTRATQFDEPVGIAFAGNSKAYVALSSVNQIAVVDAIDHKVTDYLEIGAQDPRALFVQGNRLYVVPFESGNQTELSGCWDNEDGTTNHDGDQCTFSLNEHVVANNNVLSLNYDADIVKDPRVPDRDLFIFDTETDTLVEEVWTIGTLLYGVVATRNGDIFVAQTDARNDANGRAGTLKHTLADLENRAFLNQVGRVRCGGSACDVIAPIDLEPLPPRHPTPDTALAMPYGIALSSDDSTLAVTAAGSDKLFIIDTATGVVQGTSTVGWTPRGVSLAHDADGSLTTAWVFNAIENSVSRVDLSSPSNPQTTDTIHLEDPTHPDVKLGRYMFNTARASTTGTFSCESCHPDGHTDQLLWVLGGPQCIIPGCTQIPVRSTMPIRGLRDTEPFHWDGVPGDPYGGVNGESPWASVEPNCTDELSCVRNMVDGALSSTMCQQGECPTQINGLEGHLDEVSRNAMAAYLLSIPHPPGRERPFDDLVSPLAREGFHQFFQNDGRLTCGRAGCHAMPHWTGTNTPGSGMDAPSFRGLPDRWLILPQGRVNMIDFVGVIGPGASDVPFDYQKGYDELAMWAMTFGTEASPSSNRSDTGFGPMGPWQMFLEASMGFSGAFGRQATLNQDLSEREIRQELEILVYSLENAAQDETIILHGHGLDKRTETTQPLELYFEDGAYRNIDGDALFTRAELLSLASEGSLLITLTGRSRAHVDVRYPQPALWPRRSIPLQNHIFPVLPQEHPIRIKGRHVEAGASLFINGRKVTGVIGCGQGGTLPNCIDEELIIGLERLPQVDGMYLLQIQNPDGLMSNEFIINVAQ